MVDEVEAKYEFEAKHRPGRADEMQLKQSSCNRVTVCLFMTGEDIPVNKVPSNTYDGQENLSSSATHRPYIRVCNTELFV